MTSPLHQPRRFLVFPETVFFLFGLFQAPMRAEGRLEEAEVSLIYIIQCCLQIRMGVFQRVNRRARRIFPHHFKRERGGKGRDGEGRHRGRRFGFVGVFFSFLSYKAHSLGDAPSAGLFPLPTFMPYTVK